MNKVYDINDIRRETSELSIRISEAIGTMDGFTMHIVAMVLQEYANSIEKLPGFNDELFTALKKTCATDAKVLDGTESMEEIIKNERLKRIREENEKADS